MTDYDSTSDAKRISRLVLLFFILADLGFVGIYLASVVAEWTIGFPIHNAADLNWRHSLATSWNYGKYILAIAMLLPLAIVAGRKGPAWIALLLLVLLADDALELHDKLGIILGGMLQFGFLAAMHPQDRGEPIVYLAILGISVILLMLARRDMHGPWRQAWTRFVVAIAVLAIFGAGVDIVHGVIAAFVGDEAVGFVLDVAFTVIEDGGEMVALSAILWFAFDTVLRRIFPPLPASATAQQPGPAWHDSPALPRTGTNG